MVSLFPRKDETSINIIKILVDDLLTVKFSDKYPDIVFFNIPIFHKDHLIKQVFTFKLFWIGRGLIIFYLRLTL